ncbi:MAG: hypothetical protein MI862_07085 [Desulfobacterales bacterium]|nr:hypothetical protein [Desulfobacterales bacterium]
MSPVFADSSSIILLHKAGLFDRTVARLFLVFSPSVYRELTRPGYPGADLFMQAVGTGRIQIFSPAKPVTPLPEPGLNLLDKGEKETLSLFLEYRSGFILTDDGQAARFCKKNGLPFINALLIPKLFQYAGYGSRIQVDQQMKTISSLGRYSDRVKKIARALGPDDLSRFIKEVK